MIAFGSSMASPEAYARLARPGIERAAEPDSQIYPLQAAGSLFRSYNLICEKAAAFPDLEALVLVHEDAEIVDPDFCTKLREVLRDPEVAVVGCLGAVGATSIAWWEGSLAGGSAVYRYEDAGGGDMPVLGFSGEPSPPRVRTGEVDTLDGFMMALSPWAVRTLSFDESLGQLFGYDFDYCLQARAAGRKVVVADLEVAHHHSLNLVAHNEPWVAAHMRVTQKWDGRMPHVTTNGGDWKRRARRAEAEAAVARLLVESRSLRANAREREQAARLQELMTSRSLRLTKPLRRLNALRRSRRRAAG
jgi:Glycosyltransferase like family